MSGRRRQMVALTAAGLCIGPLSRGAAQDPRDSLVRQAFSEADPSSRLRMLVRAVNPAVGPTGEAWSAGVQLFAQTLLEQGRDSVAAVWLRWAVRREPRFQVDTLQFPPRLVAALRDARAFVSRNGLPQDSAVATTWRWPAEPTVESLGRLELSAGGIESVTVEGVGRLMAGAGVDLPAGSYRIGVLSGGAAATLTREVLPGITTLLELRFPRAVVGIAVPPATQAPTHEPAMTARRRAPWKWAALGAVGAAAVVAMLAGGGREKQSTGGIIISLPGP